MNQVGLCAYYQVVDWEEAEVLFEEDMFAIKQHFIQKPWLNLTAKSRFKKLSELGVFFDKTEQDFRFPQHDSASVLDWWKQYQQLVLWGKQQIMLQENPNLLHDLLIQLFEEVHDRYVQVPELSFTELEPVFGTDPDPMFVQKEIIALNSRGISTFAEIFEHRAGISDTFLLVCKRWSMLVKYV